MLKMIYGEPWKLQNVLEMIYGEPWWLLEMIYGEPLIITWIDKDYV